MKSFWRISGILFGLGTLGWIFFAQACMRFRKSDPQARQEFARAGLALRTATLQVNGRHLHYVLSGRDSLPTLYFVHGTPGSWDAFERYLQDSDLLRKFRMVAIDRPGFGQSDFGKSEHLAVQSLLISPLFKILDNGKPNYIVGHSLGGPMIVKLVADQPAMFEGMVILSGSIDPGLEASERWRPVLSHTPLNYLVPGAMRPSNEELWYLKKDLFELQPDFQKITCPVYFIHGQADTWVPPGNVDYGKSRLTHAAKIEVTLLPGANHFIPWTRFEQIKAVLLKLY